MQVPTTFSCQGLPDKFYYSAIKNWNSLPSNVKDIQNFKCFKDKVKENILFEARSTESCEFLFFK